MSSHATSRVRPCPVRISHPQHRPSLSCCRHAVDCSICAPAAPRARVLPSADTDSGGHERAAAIINRSASSLAPACRRGMALPGGGHPRQAVCCVRIGIGRPGRGAGAPSRPLPCRVVATPNPMMCPCDEIRAAHAPQRFTQHVPLFGSWYRRKAWQAALASPWVSHFPLVR